MFDGIFQPTHLLLILLICMVLFGGKKLPELGKGLGDSIRGFKSAMAGKEETASANPQDEKREEAIAKN